MFERILQLGGTELVLLGDFHATSSNIIDRSGHTRSSEWPQTFKEYAESFGLIDVWQAQNPNVCNYTFFPNVIYPTLGLIMLS